MPLSLLSPAGRSGYEGYWGTALARKGTSR